MECYTMNSFEIEKKMYEKFIDNEMLTTKELLELGYTNYDLAKMIKEGKLRRVKRGYYDLPNADGLFIYSKILYRKSEFSQAEKTIKRCFEIEPENKSVNLNILFNGLWEDNYDQVFRCMDVLYDTDDKYYKQDLNMWLFLLGYITKVPERYEEKLQNIKYREIMVLPGDDRYKDIDKENRIRGAVARYNFSEAKSILGDFKPKWLMDMVTRRLIIYASSKDKHRKSELFSLAVDEDYQGIISLLEDNKNYRTLSYIERSIYMMASDLISLEGGKLFDIENYDVTSINNAIINNCYYSAREINSNISFKKSGTLEVLLDNIIADIESIEKERKIEPVQDDLFVACFLASEKKDLERLLRFSTKYLEKIDKSNCKEFVIDLIKLGLLEKEVNFEEVILTLSELGRDAYEYDPHLWMYTFYVSLRNKDYKKAALYLDIISMSENISGIKIDVTDMKNTFNEAIKKDNKSIADLEVSVPEVIEEKDIKEAKELVYSLPSIVNNLLNGENVVMLEPMEKSDANIVLELVRNIENIQAVVVQERENKNRIILRYSDKGNVYFDKTDAIRRASSWYKTGDYENCIDLYESILPRFREVRAFAYAQLGLSYYKTAIDNDYSKAIDYLTLANIQGELEGSDYDYSTLISKLKRRSGYDGVKVNLDCVDGDFKKTGFQYTKKY